MYLRVAQGRPRAARWVRALRRDGVQQRHAWAAKMACVCVPTLVMWPLAYGYAAFTRLSSTLNSSLV